MAKARGGMRGASRTYSGLGRLPQRGERVVVTSRYAGALAGMEGIVSRSYTPVGYRVGYALVNFGRNLSGRRLSVRVPVNSIAPR